MLLTTQYLDEADQLADRIAVIDHGKVIAEGTTGELKASVGSGASARAAARSRSGARGRAGAARERSACPSHLESDPAALDRPGRRPTPSAAAQALAGADARAGIAVADFSLGQPSLDEVFLALTGRPGRADRRAATTEEAAMSTTTTTATDGRRPSTSAPRRCRRVLAPGPTAAPERAGRVAHLRLAGAC